jgi:hypothetical protein
MRTMRNRREKCINTLEPQHLNQRILIRKRAANALSTTRVLRPVAGSASPLARRSLGEGGEDDAKSSHNALILRPRRRFFRQRAEDNTFHLSQSFAVFGRD